ncbi:DUF3179 domain-containing protein [Salinibacterium sp. SWN248]|uniref:DUF3179 domain-containing protein n=1 Tax=Salinibacterium sp. SWN248 TaxID=2792056 RepID=UPI0018CEFAF8|nr:DUF3179 domain-containing protein [Salinibacterium sp. SWN248]MBH0022864.1 DUF3179 domain-containing protein [Salinibacterium sp. SWN248]
MKKRTTAIVIAAAVAGITAIVAGIALSGSNLTSPSGSAGTTGSSSSAVDIPPFLEQGFAATDWSQADPAISQALSGGPPKDGIPAIDEPRFEPVADFEHPDDVLAIVVQGDTETKVYPYNILVWHEIVNDTIDGAPIAVSFCPLCGSAAVYDSVLPDGTVTTFGVSGGLLESNMIMFDRETETLWQQSTGNALAGTHYPSELQLHSFQLLSLGEIKQRHPDAVVLSEATGHTRDYSNNPYAGYDDSDSFYFVPSRVDDRYPSKEIFVAFTVGDTHVAAPWLTLDDGISYETTVAEGTVSLTKTDGELEIIDPEGAEIPFYFEMWFSWAVQNDDGQVFDPTR